MRPDLRDIVLIALCTAACSGKPARSYCEALCDWAVTCQSTTHGIDPAALTETCLAATRGEDPTCEKAESGTLDGASRAFLEPCVNAIDKNADELSCAGFVGSFDDIKASVPPVECATQGGDYLSTYTQAQISTAETGEELCNRFTDTVCQQAEQCIFGESTALPPGAVTGLGGTPYDLCVERVTTAFTSSCISAELWKEDEKFLDVNLAREAARACLPTISRMDCDDLFAAPPVLAPECAGAFTSSEDLLTIGEILVDIAAEYASYAP